MQGHVLTHMIAQRPVTVARVQSRGHAPGVVVAAAVVVRAPLRRAHVRARVHAPVRVERGEGEREERDQVALW